MEKNHSVTEQVTLPRRRREPRISTAVLLVGLVGLAYTYTHRFPRIMNGGSPKQQQSCHGPESAYGSFPLPGDVFRFMPCTSLTVPPSLDDPSPERSWAELFDPNPAHWSWGNTSSLSNHGDPYADQGIYMCGYLDVPLDYTNASDSRIVRLAVTKYQVSGLARVSSLNTDVPSHPGAGKKSERTIVVEPGGPGGSGTSYVWRAAEDVTRRLSGGQFDVLGWDPRGVNITRPAVSCYPYDADRDRWSLTTNRAREVSPSPFAQLELVDAMWDATFRACYERHGDLARFVGTSFVARDMEQIRKALDEDELTGYLVSYGTGIGQTYANMFPNSVGRIILDGTEYVRDHRELGGFGWTALDNGTDAWHDGFLGECLNAGPNHCALAQPKDNKEPTLAELVSRMDALLRSIIARPISGYSERSGPSLITYSSLVEALYGAMYNARSWPALAQMLYELESGNSTLATAFLERSAWEFDPQAPCAPSPSPVGRPSSDELTFLVVCADSYDAPQPGDGDFEGGATAWWDSLWANMTARSWIAGNSRFSDVVPCRRFGDYWPAPAEVYRGDLNHTLRHPVLLIAETYDPATPLRNGRRLAAEMGWANARLIAHHGYGHSSRDSSNCTDSIARDFILHGALPAEQETACHANEKPYLYDVAAATAAGGVRPALDPVKAWREHVKELALTGWRSR